ncbi:UDP-glucose 4-epimerase family protein [Methylomicrobium lacus]|uniref:UDP-glucose 4-epimerase family protein n=1 Tax=Methylomicrobium lacus TaxID=136992 RepID=UPI0035A9868B
MSLSDNRRLNILVTGANGFVGSALLRRLEAEQKFSVRAAVRRLAGLERKEGVDWIETGDLAEPADWRTALQGIDAVVHLAARVHVMRDTATDPLAEFRKANAEGTLNLARQALEAGVKRFIFISSIKVNGEATSPGRPYRADDIPAPEDAYGISKREAEDGLRELCLNSTMEFVIIRPPLVYGPGVKGNFFSMMRWLDKGVPLPLAAIQNRRSLVAVDNLIDLILVCIEHPLAANQIFLASDGEDLSTPELLSKTASALGKRARLLPVPPGLLNFAARCLGKTAAIRKLCGSLQVDTGKTRERLAWRPPVGIDQALSEAAEHYLGNRK